VEYLGVYAVVTADIVHSREHEFSIENLNDSLNGFANDLLAKRFSISRGDELQAVVSKVEALPIVLRRLKYLLIPLRLRMGIGIGFIEDSTFLNAESSWDMSGRVFFDARTALDRAKSSREMDTFFICEEPLDLFLNTVFALIDTLESGWTDKQWEAVHTYEREGTYERAAGVLGVTAPNVQSHCSKANWNVIRLAEKNISTILQEKFRVI